MPAKKPTDQMLAVLHDVELNGGSDHLRSLLSRNHNMETMYRCVRRGWLRWIATAGVYEITDAGRATCR